MPRQKKEQEISKWLLKNRLFCVKVKQLKYDFMVIAIAETPDLAKENVEKKYKGAMVTIIGFAQDVVSEQADEPV